jgi:hypothetical protein
MAELQKNLRLSAVQFDDSEDAQVIIERGVEQARGDIYLNLGVAKANEWAAVSFVENPTTEEGVLRMICNLLEVKLVLCHLVASLPNFFMDDSGGTQESYNDEAAFRKKNSEERREFCDKLKAEVAYYYALLLGTIELGDGKSLNISVIGPTEEPPTMGESTMWLPYPFNGNFRSSGNYPED